MASFSTLPSGWLPWTANGLTVAVMVAATWWSAAQRPEGDHRPNGTLMAQAPAQAANASSKKQAANATPAAPAHLVRTSATDPAAQRLPADGLLPVVYQPPAVTNR